MDDHPALVGDQEPPAHSAPMALGMNMLLGIAALGIQDRGEPSHIALQLLSDILSDICIECPIGLWLTSETVARHVQRVEAGIGNDDGMFLHTHAACRIRTADILPQHRPFVLAEHHDVENPTQ